MLGEVVSVGLGPLDFMSLVDKSPIFASRALLLQGTCSKETRGVSSVYAICNFCTLNPQKSRVCVCGCVCIYIYGHVRIYILSEVSCVFGHIVLPIA